MIKELVEELVEFPITVEQYILKENYNGETFDTSEDVISSQLAGMNLHFGMVDFITSKESRAIKAMLELGKKTKWALFHSGQSYHGYIAMRMNQFEWVQFKGKLLLMNELGKLPLIDSRWIGNCLERGHSTLRITQNNKERYTKIPTLVHREGF